MNLILVTAEEAASGTCTLTDNRAEHLRKFLHAAPGSTFRVGIIDGLQGEATVTEVTDAAVTFSLVCEEAPLQPWYDLILALPRPRSLRRILFQSAAMGVRNVFIVGAKKVEKSYFSMHLLREEEYRPVLLEGLMQGKSTILPKLTIVPKFHELWPLLPEEDTLRLIANPAERNTLSADAKGFPLIAVGPDGGWTEAENQAFAEHGFQPFTLGSRPLRTDTAAIALPAVIQDRLYFREN
jgi:RsmE family RNA methyltransferase